MLGLGFYLFALSLTIIDIDAANILACLSFATISFERNPIEIFLLI